MAGAAWVVAASATAHPATGNGPPTQADLAQCVGVPQPGAEDVRSRTTAPEIPADWRGFAAANRDWLAVRTKGGAVHCSDLAWVEELSAFEQFSDRFVGVEWSGLEAWGYTLIDRAGAGSELDTGARPVFSPSGWFMATMQFSEAGWGGFEGFAVYRVDPAGLQPVHVDTLLPFLFDWRIDEWRSGGCVIVSAISPDLVTGDHSSLDDLPRQTFFADQANGWRLMPEQLPEATCSTL